MESRCAELKKPVSRDIDVVPADGEETMREIFEATGRDAVKRVRTGLVKSLRMMRTINGV